MDDANTLATGFFKFIQGPIPEDSEAAAYLTRTYPLTLDYYNPFLFCRSWSFTFRGSIFTLQNKTAADLENNTSDIPGFETFYTYSREFSYTPVFQTTPLTGKFKEKFQWTGSGSSSVFEKVTILFEGSPPPRIHAQGASDGWVVANNRTETELIGSPLYKQVGTTTLSDGVTTGTLQKEMTYRQSNLVDTASSPLFNGAGGICAGASETGNGYFSAVMGARVLFDDVRDFTGTPYDEPFIYGTMSSRYIPFTDDYSVVAKVAERRNVPQVWNPEGIISQSKKGFEIFRNIDTTAELSEEITTMQFADNFGRFSLDAPSAFEGVSWQEVDWGGFTNAWYVSQPQGNFPNHRTAKLRLHSYDGKSYRLTVVSGAGASLTSRVFTVPATGFLEVDYFDYRGQFAPGSDWDFSTSITLIEEQDSNGLWTALPSNPNFFIGYRYFVTPGYSDRRIIVLLKERVGQRWGHKSLNFSEGWTYEHPEYSRRWAKKTVRVKWS